VREACGANAESSDGDPPRAGSAAAIWLVRW